MLQLFFRRNSKTFYSDLLKLKLREKYLAEVSFGILALSKWIIDLYLNY